MSLDVVKKVGIVLGEEQVPGRGLRRPVDLLITRIVPALLLLTSAVTTINRFAMKPVQCFLEQRLRAWPGFSEVILVT